MEWQIYRHKYALRREVVAGAGRPIGGQAYELGVSYNFNLFRSDNSSVDVIRQYFIDDIYNFIDKRKLRLKSSGCDIFLFTLLYAMSIDNNKRFSRDEIYHILDSLFIDLVSMRSVGFRLRLGDVKFYVKNSYWYKYKDSTNDSFIYQELDPVKENYVLDLLNAIK